MIEGFIRLAFTIGYIWLVGKMPDIKRVFSYHGAEHKTINAFEASAPMEIFRYQTLLCISSSLRYRVHRNSHGYFDHSFCAFRTNPKYFHKITKPYLIDSSACNGRL